MNRIRRLIACVIPLGLVAYLLVTAAPGGAVLKLARVGSTPTLPQGSFVGSAVAGSKPLHLTVTLQPQDPAGLAAYATDVATPSSPLFRQYLTVPEFAARFGASQTAISAVRSALQAQGMQVGDVSANSLSLPVSGTADQVEKAFSVSISQVQLPTGRTAYANVQSPQLTSNIAQYVQGVIGLDNVSPQQPAGLTLNRSNRHPNRLEVRTQRLRRTTRDSGAQVFTGGGPQPCTDAQNSGGLTADLISTAYQFTNFYSAGDFGQGQSVALVEEEPYSNTDIQTFEACYGLPSALPTPINVDGGPGPYDPNNPPSGEAELDIEQIIDLAPKANIIVYQGQSADTEPNSPYDILSAIVSQDLAKVISSSWGSCEKVTGGSVISGENTLLQEAAAQGQSFFISAGDAGSTMCYQAHPFIDGAPSSWNDAVDTDTSVIDPGAQPFATGVGGTELTALGPPPSEAVWNDGFQQQQVGLGGGQEGTLYKASATGGGISNTWAMPTYQSNAATFLQVVNGNSSSTPCGSPSRCREVPDVSADADPQSGYATYTNGSWGATGGTSAAAPLWAAFTAMTNASAACRGLPVGFVNPALYQIASSSYGANFHPISAANTSTGDANNDPFNSGTFNVDPPGGLYPVTGVYSMATGLGTPIAPTLAASLCAIRAPTFTVTVANPGTQSSDAGQPVALQMHASDSGGQGVAFSASGLPAGLAINAANGVVSGVPSVPGSYFVTVAAGDQFGNAGSTQFGWVVVTPPPPPPPSPRPPTVTNVSISGVAKHKPKLSFSVNQGAFSPELHAVAVSLPSGLSFSGRHKSLLKGISVTSGGRKLRFSEHVNGGTITITFAHAVAQATVTIASPALNAGSRIVAKARRHKHVTIDLKVINTSFGTTRLAENEKLK